jgi:hypothetical protein
MSFSWSGNATLFHMATPSREQFIERVIARTKTKFPLVKIARHPEHTFSVTVNGNLVPLESLYRMASLRPEELEHQVDRWIVELLRASEGVPDDKASFEDVRDRVLPMVVPADTQHASPVVSQSLVAGLNVAYALDHDRTIAYIPPAVFSRWRISLDDLHEAALENLTRRSEAIQAHAAQDEEGRVNLVLFQTMDGYDASRILLPSLHARLREYLGSPFAAAIPNRDILLCFRDEPDTVDRLKGQIEKDYRQMPHQITDRLLLVTADGIALR